MAGSRDIRAGGAFIELGVRGDYARALRDAEKQLKQVGSAVRNVGLGLAGIGSAALGGLGAATAIFSSAGDQLDKMSIRTGFSVEALSELSVAASLSGADIETLEAGIRRMQRSILDADRGMKTVTDTFAALGLTVEDLKGLSPEDQFRALAEAISKVEDPTKRAGLALELFGRSGTKLIPLFEDGAAGLDQLQRAAREFGLSVSTGDAKAAAALNDALDVLGRVAKMAAFQVGAALAPRVTQLADVLARTGAAVNNWISGNRELIVGVAKAAVIVTGLGATLVAVGTGINLIAGSLAGFATLGSTVVAAFGAIGSAVALVATPAGAAAVALAALAVVAIRSTDIGGRALAGLAERFGFLGTVAAETAEAIQAALAGGDIQAAGRVLWSGLRVLWERGARDLNRTWASVKSYFVATAYEAWYGALAALATVTARIETAWANSVAYLGDLWDQLAGGIASVWGETISFVTRQLLKLQGLFDSTLDVAAALELEEKDRADAAAQRDQRRAAAAADREAKRKADTAAAAAGEDAALGEIGRQLQAALEAVDAASGKSIANAEAALRAAREDLDQAIAAAKKSRRAPAKLGRIGAGGGDVEELLRGAGAAINGRGTPAALFGSSAAAAIEARFRFGGGGQDLSRQQLQRLDRILRAIEQLDRTTARRAATDAEAFI